MSLLLDALKKAADDKQKASHSELSEERVSPREPTDSVESPVGLSEDNKFETAVSDDDPSPDEELMLQAIDEAQYAEPAQKVTADDSAELTLDNVDQQDVVTNKSVATKTLHEIEHKQIHSNKQGVDNGSASAKFTVSDDALSLLIYKTNRDVKKGKKIVIFSLLMISFIILISGGVYYYRDMETEIAALERKHRIAMQAMQSKTNREKTPDNSEIIRNLVSDSSLDEKVQNAKRKIASNYNTSQARPVANTSVRSAVAATPGLSIQKTNKLDPVGEKLDAAWLLYESGQYKEAAALYKEVVKIEINNRDALLGLGAIAVIEKNNAEARNIYLSQLELDPRDPIATAALAGLHNESSLKTDEEYLLSMLAKNPDTPHLKFALGNNYAQQNKWQSAQQYYFNAWQNDTENADYIFNLAVSMDQLGKAQQAIGFYKDSLLKSVNKQVSFSRDAVKKRINELSRL